MTNLQMLIGLPGSGKSTYAENFLASNSGWLHISSDRIARSRFGADEEIDYREVFEEMYQQTAAALAAGHHVLYDATNLASTRRRSFLNRIGRPNAEAVVLRTSYSLLKERNRNRDSRERVPDHVLERYIRAFQFPRFNEGFTNARIISSKEPVSNAHAIKSIAVNSDATFESIAELYSKLLETQAMHNWRHREPNAAASVIQHLFEVYKKVQSLTIEPEEKELLSWFALLHDIGKASIRKNRPFGEDNFHGHEHVSAYLAYQVLLSLNFSPAFIYDVTLLIDEHEEAKKMKQGKLKRRLGERNHERMQILLDLIGA
ncbi:AAA family ATPase [Planococcus lenghuensis]|uniref:HD domain-containing protein n=1 Tax=Planococcus lenghuensis TaxID=2213202 RepID=A0A1Q2KWL4_9BACL|nr:AAA family ATPase [Planococcus lenghuensis]AQQ52516.1 hypothetical protein B0X71_05015 [Planococcus lenghuensis]